MKKLKVDITINGMTFPAGTEVYVTGENGISVWVVPVFVADIIEHLTDKNMQMMLADYDTYAWILHEYETAVHYWEIER